MDASRWIKASAVGTLILGMTACTITTGSTDDGILLDDDDSGAVEDDDAGACPIIGNESPAIVDLGSDNCNDCASVNCCNEVSNCFTRESDGGLSECADLDYSCISECDVSDPGYQDCVDTCKSVYSETAVSQWSAYDSCLTNYCSEQCQ